MEGAVARVTCMYCETQNMDKISLFSMVKPNISLKNYRDSDWYILKHSFRGNNFFLISGSMQVIQSLLLICDIHGQGDEPGLSGSRTEDECSVHCSLSNNKLG